MRSAIDSTRRALAIAETMVGDIAHGRDAVSTRVRHWLHQRRSNQANIQHHYDVSNAFYKLWLDARMVYSCAYFHAEDDSLDDAQAQKLDHICRKLRLQPGDRFLDIGCGWGALLFWAATRYDVEATGITLSQNQFDHVRAVAAPLVAPRAEPPGERVLAVRDVADHALGDRERLTRAAGEVDVVVHVRARERAHCGRGERFEPAPGAREDFHLRSRRERQSAAVGQHQRHRQITAAVAVGDDLL